MERFLGRSFGNLVQGFALVFCGVVQMGFGALSSPMLPEPYANIELYDFDGHGWYYNGPQMAALIANTHAKVVIEVGSWLGASTRHIATCVPQGGKVYAVDHWLGSVEHQVGAQYHYRALPYLYEQFLSNVIHANLTDKIVPVRMSSDQAMLYLSDVRPDIVYIDASHETEAVYADLVGWYPFVEGHGVLCGDDWGWASVRKAVERFAVERGLKVYPSNNFWRLAQ